MKFFVTASLLVASASALSSSVLSAQGTSDPDVTVCYQNMVSEPRTFFLPFPLLQPRFRSLDGMFFVERADGTASLTGAIENLADPTQRFSVQVDFSGLVQPGDANYPPTDSPFLSPFVISNLVPGGTIDTDTWRYYTSTTGTLTGQLAYEGAVLDITGTGPAYQIGNGGNLFELGEGGSGWFDWTVVSQPTDTSIVLPATGTGDSNGVFGNDCICFGGQEAMSTNYGTGTAGCAGIPTISSTLPLTNTTVEIRIGNPNDMATFGALMWSLNQASINDPNLGGIRLVDPILAVDVLMLQPGETPYDCFAANDACLIGQIFNVQAVLIDSCGPTGFSLTDGLELKIGDL